MLMELDAGTWALAASSNEQAIRVARGERSHRHFRPIEASRERAIEVRAKMPPRGHYPAEQAPDETYAELRALFL